MAKRKANLYSHYIEWSKLIRLVKVGQILTDRDGARYEIIQKLVSNIKGSTAKLTVKKLTDDEL